MHRFYFLIYETSSRFHGRRWRNLSGSNASMLVISVNTFLKYFSGSNWLSLAVEDELPSLWVNAAIEGDPVLLWLMSERGIGALEIFEWSSEEHSVQKHFSSGIAWFTISTKIFEVSIFRFFWYTILPKPLWNLQSFRFVLLPDQTGLIVCHLPEDDAFFQLFSKSLLVRKAIRSFSSATCCSSYLIRLSFSSISFTSVSYAWDV